MLSVSLLSLSLLSVSMNVGDGNERALGDGGGDSFALRARRGRRPSPIESIGRDGSVDSGFVGSVFGVSGFVVSAGPNGRDGLIGPVCRT